MARPADFQGLLTAAGPAVCGLAHPARAAAGSARAAEVPVRHRAEATAEAARAQEEAASVPVREAEVRLHSLRIWERAAGRTAAENGIRTIKKTLTERTSREADADPSRDRPGPAERIKGQQPGLYLLRSLR